jgi:hypothetical protein
LVFSVVEERKKPRKSRLDRSRKAVKILPDSLGAPVLGGEGSSKIRIYFAQNPRPRGEGSSKTWIY